MIRSFIALELSDHIHKQLALTQTKLKKAQGDVKWVEPSSIHLTLKFLGDVSFGLLEDIKPEISALAQENRAFEMAIEGLGAFPTLEHPRVIWVGIGQGKEITISLAKDLERRLRAFGFLPEKRGFKPHLTLGRVRSSENRAPLTGLLGSTAVGPTSMRVETVTLFQSTLTPKGAIYQPLYRANFI